MRLVSSSGMNPKCTMMTYIIKETCWIYRYSMRANQTITCYKFIQAGPVREIDADDEEEKEPNYLTGIISQGQIDWFILKHQTKFAELDLNHRNLVQLVSHPITL